MPRLVAGSLTCQHWFALQNHLFKKREKTCLPSNWTIFIFSPRLPLSTLFFSPGPLCLLALSIDYLPVYVRGYLGATLASSSSSSSHLCLCLFVCVSFTSLFCFSDATKPLYSCRQAAGALGSMAPFSLLGRRNSPLAASRMDGFTAC